MAASLVNHDQTPSNGNRNITDTLHLTITCVIINTISAIAHAVMAINGAAAIMLLAMATMHTIVVLEM